MIRLSFAVSKGMTTEERELSYLGSVNLLTIWISKLSQNQSQMRICNIAFSFEFRLLISRLDQLSTVSFRFAQNFVITGPVG